MLRRHLQVALGLLLVGADAAFAQRGSCVLDTEKPQVLYGARRYVLLIGTPPQPNQIRNEKPEHLKTGSRLLLEDERVLNIENQTGRAYLLGKLYVLWLNLPGTTPIVTREQLGLAGPKDAPVDLYRVIDSAFTVVENSNPACADSTSPYRRTVFAHVYNPAVAALNAKQYDSALVLANRSLVIFPRSASAWNVVVQAKMGKQDMPGYAAALRKLIEVGANDPTVKGTVEQGHYNLAILRMQDAQKAEGEARRTAAKEAETIFRKYLEMKPGDPAGSVGLAQALQLLGDSAAAGGVYADMLKNPEKHSAASLAEAGVAAFRAQRYEEAMQFFDASLKKNTHHAQTLFNYINAAISAKKLTEATGMVPRLIAVDPSNYDNITLAARAWQAVVLAAGGTPSKEATDSALHYVSARSNSTISVKFNAFVPRPGNAQTFEGVIENRSDAAKSFDFPVECLDATGGVVATTKITVADIPPKAAKEFKVQCAGAGIMAFKYKPVS
jgi:tetratricopeptide (TPR) repeat protein